MEGRVQNQIQALGTIGHVFWTNKLTQHFPGNDECHLQGSD
jgi:hypothetical protein